MARALWTGSLSCGLVNIRVEIHNAVRDKGPHFGMLRKKTTPPSSSSVSRNAMASRRMGAKRQRLRVLEGAFRRPHARRFPQRALKKDRIIDILDFVSVDATDDRFFDKPYYLLLGKGGAKAYALLREAIKATGQIGVAKFVLRSKQRLAAIEAIDEALVLSTMRFRDELDKLDDYEFPASRGVQKRDLQMAQRLIGEFSAHWDPEKYTDDHRENIKKVIAAKQKRPSPTCKSKRIRRPRRSSI
jgi:DNA end-binding protein Ku